MAFDFPQAASIGMNTTEEALRRLEAAFMKRQEVGSSTWHGYFESEKVLRNVHQELVNKGYTAFSVNSLLVVSWEHHVPQLTSGQVGTVEPPPHEEET